MANLPHLLAKRLLAEICYYLSRHRLLFPLKESIFRVLILAMLFSLSVVIYGKIAEDPKYYPVKFSQIALYCYVQCMFTTALMMVLNLSGYYATNTPVFGWRVMEIVFTLYLYFLMNTMVALNVFISFTILDSYVLVNFVLSLAICISYNIEFKRLMTYYLMEINMIALGNAKKKNGNKARKSLTSFSRRVDETEMI